MLKKLAGAGIALTLLASCISDPAVTSAPAVEPVPKVARQGRPQSVADFLAVASRVEPVAEQVCREMRPGANCDFKVIIDPDADLPPNAYQTLDRSGQPIIGFTQSLLRKMVNTDELAFALSHEAAHHIAGHIPQTVASAQTGALLGAVLGSLAGLDAAGVETAQNIGGTFGARRFSKNFELEADSLGARIAKRAGFDPLRGVLYFQSAPDPGDRFLGTHPPNADRIRIVRRTVAG